MWIHNYSKMDSCLFFWISNKHIEKLGIKRKGQGEERKREGYKTSQRRSNVLIYNRKGYLLLSMGPQKLARKNEISCVKLVQIYFCILK